MSGNDKEIPEDLFRKEFGGAEFEKRREKVRTTKILALGFNGVLFMVLAPPVLGAIAGVIAYLYYCRWGIGCKF